MDTKAATDVYYDPYDIGGLPAGPDASVSHPAARLL
jgi:hypothetical protein